MNAPQIHLMLNHLPVIGMVFVIVTIAVGMLTRKDMLMRFGLTMLVALALAAVPVFLSGEPAEESIEDLAGVSKHAIERHEDIARATTIALGALGLVSLIVLVRHRGRAVGRGLTASILVLSLALGSLLAWTAHLGGQIHHPELRDAEPTAGAVTPGEGEAGEHE